MKLLGAEEDELLEGVCEMAGDFREAERGRVAAEEEIQDELLAGGETGNERTAIARESGCDRVVRGFGVVGKRCKRRLQRSRSVHRRRLRNDRNEVEHELNRLARLVGREEVANPDTAMRRTRRDLIAARDQLVYCRSDPNHRFLLSQFQFPFR